MKNHYRILAVSAYFCAVSAFAGAWVQKIGTGLDILTVRRYISDQNWTSGGNLTPSSTYAKNELDNYAEYGVTDKLTLGLYLSAIASHTSAMGTQRGWDDTMLLGRYLLWTHQNAVMSVQLSADKLGHGATFNVPPQNSSLNTGESILIGTSGAFATHNPRYWFADASFGLLQRYSAGNQLQINLEAGYKTDNDRWWLMLQNYNTFDTGHVNYPQGVNYNLVTVSPSVVYWPTKSIGVQLGVAQDIYGQNVGKGRTMYLGTWWRFGTA